MFLIISFIFGLFGNLSIKIIGDLYFAHIFILLFFFYLFLKKKINSFPKKILLLAFLWLLNQILSDIINGTQFNDYLRGIIKIIFFIISIIVFYNLENLNKANLVNFILYYSVGYILNHLIFHLNDFHINWKFGIANSLLIILLSFICINNSNKKFFYYIIIFLIGIYSLYLDSRLNFLFSLIIILHFILLKIFNSLQINKKNFIFFLFFIYLTLFLVFQFYEFLFNNNYLPNSLYERQLSQSGSFGLFIGGRSEIIASIKAIIDKPFLGHGSWANNCDYVNYLSDFLFMNFYNKFIDLDNCLIPTHSFIFGAWVYSGIFGFIFFIYLTFIIIKQYFKILSQPNNYTILNIYLICVVLWDLLFSPMSGYSVLIIPLYISIILKKY